MEGEMSKSQLTGVWNFENNAYNVVLTEDYSEGSIPLDVHYLHSEEKLFEDSTNSPIAEIELTLLYPVKEETSIIDSIQNYISEMFFGDGSSTHEADTMLTEFESSYFNKYREYNTESYSPGASFNWQNIINMTVLNNSENLLSLEFLKYAYTGGAHGMTNISYCNIDLTSGSRYKSSDIFKPHSDSILSTILTGKLYLNRKIPHDVSLKEAGYFVDKIEPNNNFYINNSGSILLKRLYPSR